MAAETQSSAWPFAECTISFAVDVSGSTSGKTLEAEKKFVGDISQHLSEAAKDSTTILPWNHEAQGVRSLAQLPSLTSSGMTSPDVLLRKARCRDALRGSSIWFLITDGIIPESNRIDFANLIPKAGMHGTTCVTIIFGRTNRSVASANISVGVSVFAIVPNCLFLFYDVETDEIYVLQSKGFFKDSVGIESITVIDHTTSWASLPRFSPSLFSDITIPAPTKLAENEIALQDGLVVNMDDLWANELGEEKVARIFSRNDNLNSVMMTAQSRSNQYQFQSWVQKQEVKTEDPVWMAHDDLNGRAAAAFKDAIRQARTAGSIDAKIQESLRGAFSFNLKAFIQARIRSQKTAKFRNLQVQRSSERSVSSCIDTADSMSSTMSYQDSDTDDTVFTPPSELDHPALNPYQSQTPTLPGRDSFLWSKISNGSFRSNHPRSHQITDPKLRSVMHTPGFRNLEDSFTGTCSLCGADNTILAWVFHASPQIATIGIPEPNSATPLAFPLAMGNFAETDILSTTICCDPCSYFATKLGLSPNDERVTGALPMVCYPGNEKAYLSVLTKVLGNRFAQDALPQVLLSILISTPEVGFCSTPSSLQLFRSALEWTCKNILRYSRTLPELSQTFTQNAFDNSQTPLGSAIYESFVNLDSPKSSLMLYPLEGFIVLLRVAQINEIHHSLRARAVFRRLLLHLTETYLSLPQDERIVFMDRRPQTIENAVTRALWIASPAMSKDATVILQQDQMQQDNQPEPLISVSIAQLRETPLLPEEAYSTFGKIPEFRIFVDEAPEWVAPSLGLFLHAMIAVQSMCQLVDAMDLLDRTTSLPLMAPFKSKMEQVTLDSAEAAIQQIYT
ncbi:hypothetical protein CC78DRAFT_532836 [Lojkania enalia]|uniref:VWFA domain-containing protein n=1 Tax=Lojkania enalia TaxID=147567 RepID=A0A9P4KC14_9PLEO|nr:hypothetical protein CC78DRAFT_532836 [Didymosphaeria enalia]